MDPSFRWDDKVRGFVGITEGQAFAEMKDRNWLPAFARKTEWEDDANADTILTQPLKERAKEESERANPRSEKRNAPRARGSPRGRWKTGLGRGRFSGGCTQGGE
jgi:hypothetical protein